MVVVKSSAHWSLQFFFKIFEFEKNENKQKRAQV